MKRTFVFSLFFFFIVVASVAGVNADVQDPVVEKYSVSPSSNVYDFTDVDYRATADSGVTFPPSTIDLVQLCIRVNFGSYQYFSMSYVEANIYAKYNLAGNDLIDAADGGDTIYYYFYCHQTPGNQEDVTEVFSYVLEVDDPPVISDVVQVPVSGSVSYLDDLVNITCTVIDDISILYVKIYYTIHYSSGSSSDNDVMTNLSGDVYNYTITDIHFNVLVTYIIYSSDENANYAETEEYSFTPYDSIDPNIVSVDYDSEFTFSIGEHLVDFIVIEDNPGSYVLYCDSVVLKEGVYVNYTLVSLDISNLVEGDYSFELIVYDDADNQDSEVFSVSVVSHVLEVPDVVLPVVYTLANQTVYAVGLGSLFFAVSIAMATRIVKKNKKKK